MTPIITSLWLPLSCAVLATSITTVQSAPTLPFNDVNVVVLTDDHSWLGGHGQHVPNSDADLGDILSFYNQLKSHADKQKRDLFFVMNGDFVDGTGLSTVPPKHLTPILERMPYDAVNIGNHELYHNETIEYMVNSGFISHWNGNYLTSNVLLATTNKPMGSKYTYLTGTHSKSTILTFGFLYDMKDNAPAAIVERVEDVVQQSWFKKVLTAGNFDAVMVLAHMDCDDALVKYLLKSIRDIAGTSVPVQFMTGHSHRRAYTPLDAASTSFEAGRFVDTVGFVSFPLKPTSAQDFQHVFIDASKNVLNKTLGDGLDLKTAEGKALSKLIYDTQVKLGLTKVLGCSPSDYDVDAAIGDTSSLWGLYLNKVVPSELFHSGQNEVFIQGTGGALRYPIYQGKVTVDDVIAVDPFFDVVYKVSDAIPGDKLYEALHNLTVVPSGGKLPPYGMSPQSLDKTKTYTLYASGFSIDRIVSSVGKVTGKYYKPEPVYISHGVVQNTTGMIQSYIADQWKCHKKSHNKKAHNKKAHNKKAHNKKAHKKAHKKSNKKTAAKSSLRGGSSSGN